MKKTDAILIAGSPARYSDLRYATGLFSFDPVIFLRTRQRRFLIVSPLDFGHVRRTVKDMEVLSFSDFPPPKNSKTPSSLRSRSYSRLREARYGGRRKVGGVGACDRIINLLKNKNIRSVTVPPYFPIGLAEQLTGKGVMLSVAEGAVFPEREIKTAKEIKHIIHAQKAAIKAMDNVIVMIAGAKIGRDRSLRIGNKPLTSEAVRNRIDDTARDFDCVCYGTIVACGRQAVNPHEAGWGTLKANEPIVIDIFPQHIKNGHWGDLTRTVVRGAPSPEIQKMYSAVREAQKAAISKIKAGVTAEKIHNTAVNLFKERGFFTGARNGKQVGFIHGIGHGLGLEIHENPSVGPVATKLKEGNVITIEPGLYYHEHGAIRIEDIVLVTRAGSRILAPYVYPFIV